MKQTGTSGSVGASPLAQAELRGESAAGQSVFYRYRDPNGRVVIVDSLARVPSNARDSVESVALEPTSSVALPVAVARDLHWPSFAAGAGCALLASLLLLFALRTKAALLRVVMLGALVALGAGAYFGWVRRTTGHDGALMQSPAALIDDARTAVDQMNERVREQERVLRELEAER
jgi:hypothetical protein